MEEIVLFLNLNLFLGANHIVILFLFIINLSLLSGWFYQDDRTIAIWLLLS